MFKQKKYLFIFSDDLSHLLDQTKKNVNLMYKQKQYMFANFFLPLMMKYTRTESVPLFSTLLLQVSGEAVHSKLVHTEQPSTQQYIEQTQVYPERREVQSVQIIMALFFLVPCEEITLVYDTGSCAE